MKQTQTQMVWDMLKAYPGGSTAMDAMKDLGVMRLAARINNLRAEGHNIVSELVKVKTRHGVAHVASYRIVNEKGGKK
jgi:hypothetical protein